MAYTKFIIIAAGEATRWGNHLGVPKHFAPLGGEPIIERTVRLLQENGAEDITVVSRDYDLSGAKNHHIVPNYEDNADADKFLSSSDLWNEHGRTVIVYGDVYFTEAAISEIVRYGNTQWTLFCRPWESKITGTPYGECFAVSFYPQDNERGKENLQRLVGLYGNKVLDRIGGWEWARIMADVPQNDLSWHHENLHVYRVIDDETDDIDFPDDYERLKKVVGA